MVIRDMASERSLWMPGTREAPVREARVEYEPGDGLGRMILDLA